MEQLPHFNESPAETHPLTFEQLKMAVAHGTAIRIVSEFQPADSSGDKICPPTYEGGECATEDRWVYGRKVTTVLLDSVQPQANRMELALLAAYGAKMINFLMAVNPHRKNDGNILTPEELLDIIETKEHEVAEAVTASRNPSRDLLSHNHSGV